MKLKTVQEYKQLRDTVEIDLEALKKRIETLEDILGSEDCDADEVRDYCEFIVKLANAIGDGVENC